MRIWIAEQNGYLEKPTDTFDEYSTELKHDLMAIFGICEWWSSTKTEPHISIFSYTDQSESTTWRILDGV